MKLLLLVLMLIACAGCGSGDDNNHGYGFEFDVQGASGLRLRYSGAVAPGGTVATMISDPVFYERIFAEVEACMAMTAPAPFVIIVKHGELDGGVAGHHFSDPQLIVVDVTYILTNRSSVLRHEIIHYLLDINTGDPDPNHSSAVFAECS